MLLHKWSPSYNSCVQPSELPPPSEGRPWATLEGPPQPSKAEQARWTQGHPNEMRPWDRPGALSRTKLTRARFVAQRPEIQVSLFPQSSPQRL